MQELQLEFRLSRAGGPFQLIANGTRTSVSHIIVPSLREPSPKELIDALIVYLEDQNLTNGVWMYAIGEATYQVSFKLASTRV